MSKGQDEGEDEGQAERAQWMSVLARASRADLEAHWDGLADEVAFTWLKKPEFGTVLVRGRVNGRDAEFNVGELALTRCSLQLADGAIGIAYVPGCDARHAMMAAVLDALLQPGDARSARTRAAVAAIAARLAQRRAQAAAKTATSRADFTMAMRG